MTLFDPTLASPLRAQLAQVQSDINEKRRATQLAWVKFEQARDATLAGKSSAEEGAAVQREYHELATELKHLEDVRDGILRGLGGKNEAARAPLSAGELAVSSLSYRELQFSGALSSDTRAFQAKLAELDAAETKTLITGLSDTSGGAFVTPDRAGYVSLPQRPTSILDLISIGNTGSDTIEYARQGAWTNVAAEVAEATTTATGTKPEATLPFEKVSETVRTIAHWVPATRRALADGGQLQQVIDHTLRYGLQLRLEDQIVQGDGSSENLRGIVNTPGILSQAKAADTVVDAVHKALTQLALGNVSATGIAMHPNDWEAARLLRDNGGYTAGTGAYLLGSPGIATRPTLWGLPVALTTAVGENTAIVGDWSQAQLWIREGATILASDSHEDYFTKNLVAILVEMRAAFSVLAPTAFCKVTGV